MVQDHCEKCGENIFHRENSTECFILQEWAKDRTKCDTLEDRIKELEAELSKIKEVNWAKFNEQVYDEIEEELQRYKAANECLREPLLIISKDCGALVYGHRIRSDQALIKAAAILETQTEDQCRICGATSTNGKRCGCN